MTKDEKQKVYGPTRDAHLKHIAVIELKLKRFAEKLKYAKDGLAACDKKLAERDDPKPVKKAAAK